MSMLTDLPDERRLELLQETVGSGRAWCAGSYGPWSPHEIGDEVRWLCAKAITLERQNNGLHRVFDDLAPKLKDSKNLALRLQLSLSEIRRCLDDRPSPSPKT